MSHLILLQNLPTKALFKFKNMPLEVPGGKKACKTRYPYDKIRMDVLKIIKLKWGIKTNGPFVNSKSFVKYGESVLLNVLLTLICY